ncbi:MAG: Xaa-Pro peptidase family protein [Erysipelotrichaceae bacterium]|nr:Xaa-Pro peptidase family protein [Erysipelotrichaceae bacterium]
MGFSKEKFQIIYQSLQKYDVDMWIVAGQESATKSEPVLDIISDSEFIGKTALIFTKDKKARVVCTPIDANGYEITGVFEKIYPFPVGFEDTLSEVIKELEPKNIALDYSRNNPSADGLSMGMYQLIKNAVDKSGIRTEIVSAENLVVMVRGIKTAEEIRKIRRAVEETEVILNDVKKVIKAGVNCQDIYAFIQGEVERKGFGYSWPKSQDPGVVAGIGCPQGHVGAPDFVIKKGDVVNVDFGIVLDGYGSDIQRMYYVLKDDEDDAPEDVKKAFYAVRDGIQLSAKALKPGVTGNYVDSVARDYIVSLGYPSWNAALGHQLGKVAHDGGPLLGPRKPRYNRPELIDAPLFENMVFTLEPGVPTSAGRLGLEEDVVVTKDGAQFLVPPQMELYLIR